MKQKLKKNYPLLVMSLFSLTSISQVEVEWSADLSNDNSMIKILGEDDQGIISLSGSKKDYFINNYNSKTLKRKYAKMMEVAEHDGIKVEIEEVMFMKENIIVAISGYDKDNDLAITYGLSYNQSTGKLNQKVISLSEIEVESKRRSGSFGFKTSDNGEFLMIYHYAKLKKSGKQQLSITIYDNQLELIKEFQRDFDFDSNGNAVFGLYEFTIDDEGNIFYIQTEASGERAGYNYLISHMFMEDYEKRELQIEITSQNNSSYSGVTGLNIMSDGKMVYLGGYYFELSSGVFKYLGVNGTFYAKVDPLKDEVLVQSISPFDDELKYQILKRKHVEKGKMIPASFRIKDMELTKDGEVVIVSEQYVRTQTQSRGMQTTQYLYGSIIVTKVTQEGQIEWNRAIVKTQVYTDVKPVIGIGGSGIMLSAAISLTKDETIYYSYLMGVVDGEFHFIYNDNLANFELGPEDHKKLTNPKKGVPAIVTISSNGEMKKIPGYGVLPNDVILRPRISKQVSENEVLVYASRKKANKIGRIIFK